MVITEVSIVKMPLPPPEGQTPWLSELAPQSVHWCTTLNIAICGRLKLARFNSVLCVCVCVCVRERERERKRGRESVCVQYCTDSEAHNMGSFWYFFVLFSLIRSHSCTCSDAYLYKHTSYKRVHVHKNSQWLIQLHIQYTPIQCLCYQFAVLRIEYEREMCVCTIIASQVTVMVGRHDC